MTGLDRAVGTVKIVLSYCILCALAFAADAASPRFAFDRQSVLIDGKREFLISGEFHYFRVPRAEWGRRLELLKGIGGNCVATYVPWCLHEQKEGEIVFGDRPERDLDAFLKCVKRAGLMAIVRPGPYQYSELSLDGLPRWLVENYPDVHFKTGDGKRLRTGSVAYNHPVFLEKTRRYFKAVSEVLRPHLAKNGGCVELVQLDNELTGIHLWFGAQGSVPYFEDCADYLVSLRDCLAENGIVGPYCHNTGGTMMCPNYEPCVRKLGNRDFLLGYDNYYNLSLVQKTEHPNNEYFMKSLFACDMMRAYGYPPLAFELQAGSTGDSPYLSPTDLFASYMVSVAAGLKGLNYYVFTGGRNPDGLGALADVYDYHAPVGADGEIRPAYESLQRFGDFVRKHPGLLEATRLSSVRVGFEWRHFAGCAKADSDFFRYGMVYTLLQSGYQPEHYLLGQEIPLDKPLVLAGIESMSERVQRQVIDFVRAGGRLLVAPDFPRTDLEGRPCEIMAKALGGDRAFAEAVDTALEPACLAHDLKVYGLSPLVRLSREPDLQVLLKAEKDGRPFAGIWSQGSGRVLQLGVRWTATTREQISMTEQMLAALGARPVAKSSEPNVFHSSFALPGGKTAVFVMNLRASECATVMGFPSGFSKAFELKPMEVAYFEY